jgi:ATP-dependent Clp protease ATP-binding subunit ClpA
MSKECTAGLVMAQQVAARFGIAEVETPMVLQGCVENFETTALEKTLKRFGITRKGVAMATFSRYVNRSDAELGWLSYCRNQTTGPDEKPFDMATTHVLCRAGELANEMQSSCVQSHHVFLALLDYQKGREDDGGDSIAATATKNNEVWQMLLSLGVPLTDQKTVLDVCKVLVTNLNKQNKRPPKYKAETPNLDNLGVDFTKKARLGLLDVVHGRDMEIGAALRTLMRRRKNNVVLIGEAGVGTNIIR